MPRAAVREALLERPSPRCQDTGSVLQPRAPPGVFHFQKRNLLQNQNHVPEEFQASWGGNRSHCGSRKHCEHSPGSDPPWSSHHYLWTSRLQETTEKIRQEAAAPMDRPNWITAKRFIPPQQHCYSQAPSGRSRCTGRGQRLFSDP